MQIYVMVKYYQLKCFAALSITDFHIMFISLFCLPH